jgi:hypothetical protein
VLGCNPKVLGDLLRLERKTLVQWLELKLIHEEPRKEQLLSVA